jgi:hypothetical protein
MQELKIVGLRAYIQNRNLLDTRSTRYNDAMFGDRGSAEAQNDIYQSNSRCMIAHNLAPDILNLLTWTTNCLGTVLHKFNHVRL